MALKAIYDGMYRKSGTRNLVFRYLVQGTNEEVERYKTEQGANLRAQEGTNIPFFFLTEKGADGIKRLPKKQLDLVFGHERGVYVDDSKNMFDRAARVEEAMIAAEATERVKLELGITTLAAPVQAAPAAIAQKAPQLKEPEFDMAATGGPGGDETLEN